MASKKNATQTVYAVVIPSIDSLEGMPIPQIISIHAKEEDAKDVAAQRGMTVESHEVQSGSSEENAAGKGSTKPAKTGDANGDSVEAKKKSKKTNIPDGRPDSLTGYVLMFSGTFEHMDRATCEATATKYGATVSKKMDEVNYAVLGTKAGPKKLEEITSKGIKTMKEADFLELIGAHFEEPPTKKAKK